MTNAARLPSTSLGDSVAKRISLVPLIVFLLLCFSARATENPHPLRQSELLALVAGNTLPENVVNEIHARGVAFRADAGYQMQLTEAGATPAVLAALKSAKPVIAAGDEEKTDPALLQHMVDAAKLMKANNYEAAGDELAAGLQGNFEKFEFGFVMGELLSQQGDWPRAAAVYAEVLHQAPNFPEAHAKLSYALHRIGQYEESLREAKAELARAPQDAEAHRCAGIALGDLLKYDAAEAEFREALRIKPDYALVHYDLAVTFGDQRQTEKSIAEYKKTLALDPDFINARYNLAHTLQDQDHLEAALEQYREAKRRAPNRFDIRMNLGSTLVANGRYPEALSEFRELTAMYPDSTMALNALAGALYTTRDFQGAEKEYRKSAALDPTDPQTFTGLGWLYEHQTNPKLDAALEQYRCAKDLDPNSADASLNIGRVQLIQRKVSEALKELQDSITLGPSNAVTHDLYAQALLLSGDTNRAITEFKESLGLDPKQFQVMLELAAALEKKGDWPAALSEYDQAAVAESATAPAYGPSFGGWHNDAADRYKEAQERFSKQLAALKGAGKSSEAAKLEKSIQDQQDTSDSAHALDSLMLSGSQAFSERRFDDAERDYRKALEKADKLQPHDSRLTTTLNHLGQLAVFRQDFAGADVLFERQLKVAEEIYGPNSSNLDEAIKFLSLNAMAAKDYLAAKKFLDRDLELNRKTYGENSANYTQVLRIFAMLYMNQEQYEKAEPYLLQATEVEAKLYNYDSRYGGLEYINLLSLCILYDHWGNADKLNACDRRLIPIVEKLSGTDTHLLETLLTQQAKSLRTLGRPEEATKIEERLKSLQPSATNNPN
jgi:tetratricopeptide (TPR) repeat protein